MPDAKPRVGFVLALLALAAGAIGCGKQETSAPPAAVGPRKVVLQSDWLPQGEHGGFYQALARGFYREAGLEVEIAPGGPGALPQQKAALGQVAFSLSRSDDVVVGVSRGQPIVMVMALMQRDPQALLLHEESPVNSFRELDGRTVMAAPGSAWIEYLQAQYGITLKLVPLSYGLGRFLTDRDFIQQCFITNEPQVVRERGVRAKTLLIADSGYDPYRVVIAQAAFARRESALVRAFVAASIRGWEEYLEGDAAPADALLLKLNPGLTPEFLRFTRQAMREHRLVSGRAENGEKTGLLDPRRIQEQIDLLARLGITERRVTLEEVLWTPSDPAAGER